MAAQSGLIRKVRSQGVDKQARETISGGEQKKGPVKRKSNEDPKSGVSKKGRTDSCKQEIRLCPERSIFDPVQWQMEGHMNGQHNFVKDRTCDIPDYTYVFSTDQMVASHTERQLINIQRTHPVSSLGSHAVESTGDCGAYVGNHGRAQETSQATPSNFQRALPAMPTNPYASMVLPTQMTFPETFPSAPHEQNESYSTSVFPQRQMLQFASFSASNKGLFSPGYLQQPTSVHQAGSWDCGGSGVPQSFANPISLGSTTSAMLWQQSIAGSNRAISTPPGHTLPSHSINCQFSQSHHHGSSTHAEEYRAASRSYFPFQPICHCTNLVLSQHSANFNIERATLRDSIFPYQPINFGESIYHNLDTLYPPINCEANTVHNSILSCQPIKSMEEISANLIGSSRPIHAGGQIFQNSIASFQPINLQTPQT